MRARFYSPVLGRFLSADPLVGGSSPLIVNLALSSVQGLNLPAKFGSAAMSRAPSNPQSLDRYAYAMNNPLRYTDPTGLFKNSAEEAVWQFIHGLVDRGWTASEISHAIYTNLHRGLDKDCCKGDAAAVQARWQVGARYWMGKVHYTDEEGNVYFDCSGLTYWSYQQGGVDIGRSAQQQYNRSTTIEKESDLQPGDLVFYGKTYSECTDDICHVAMYVGDGKIVVADNDGVHVDYLDAYMRDDFVSHGRPAY